MLLPSTWGCSCVHLQGSTTNNVRFFCSSSWYYDQCILANPIYYALIATAVLFLGATAVIVWIYRRRQHRLGYGML
jgi:hypothetical protein